jgi:hypothetical protein
LTSDDTPLIANSTIAAMLSSSPVVGQPPAASKRAKRVASGSNASLLQAGDMKPL